MVLCLDQSFASQVEWTPVGVKGEGRKDKEKRSDYRSARSTAARRRAAASRSACDANRPASAESSASGKPRAAQGADRSGAGAISTCLYHSRPGRPSVFDEGTLELQQPAIRDPHTDRNRRIEAPSRACGRTPARHARSRREPLRQPASRRRSSAHAARSRAGTPGSPPPPRQDRSVPRRRRRAASPQPRGVCVIVVVYLKPGSATRSTYSCVSNAV